MRSAIILKVRSPGSTGILNDNSSDNITFLTLVYYDRPRVPASLGKIIEHKTQKKGGHSDSEKEMNKTVTIVEKLRRISDSAYSLWYTDSVQRQYVLAGTMVTCLSKTGRRSLKKLSMQRQTADPHDYPPVVLLEEIKEGDIHILYRKF